MKYKWFVISSTVSLVGSFNPKIFCLLNIGSCSLGFFFNRFFIIIFFSLCILLLELHLDKFSNPGSDLSVLIFP